jgi:NhaP-type Na+/H+ or K+/H+ antiporter
MVVRQYKAKGPLTDLLLPIVALDDAVGLVVFAVSFGIAQAMDGGTLNVVSVIVNPLLEIVCSLALGAAMGEIVQIAVEYSFELLQSGR